MKLTSLLRKWFWRMPINVTINATNVYMVDPEIGLKLDAISSKLDQLTQGEQQMEVDLTALKQAVAEEKTVSDSAIALLNGLKAKLDALASQPTVNPADLQALADSINAEKDNLAAAVTANTPAA